MNISRYFETRKRKAWPSFTTLTDDRPEWLYQAVMDAHDGEMPNDWRYEPFRDIAVALDEFDVNDEDTIVYIADRLTDVYTHHLLTWVADNLNRTTYVDDVIEEGHTSSLSGQLMAAQSHAIEVMATILIDAIRENAEEES